MIERLQRAHIALKQLPLLNNELRAGHDVLPQIEQTDAELRLLLGGILFHLRSSLIIDLAPEGSAVQPASSDRIGSYHTLTMLGVMAKNRPLDILCMQFKQPFGSAFLSGVDTFDLKVYDSTNN